MLYHHCIVRFDQGVSIWESIGVGLVLPQSQVSIQVKENARHRKDIGERCSCQGDESLL